MNNPKTRTLLDYQKTIGQRKKAMETAKDGLPEGISFQEAKVALKAAQENYQKRNKIYEKAGQAIPEAWKRVCLDPQGSASKNSSDAFKAYQTVRKIYDQALELWRESIWFCGECEKSYQAWRTFFNQEKSYQTACQSLEMAQTLGRL